MRAHGTLFGILFIIGVILVFVNMGLFAFLQNDNIWHVAKNGLMGVNIEKAFGDIPVYPHASLSGASAKQLRFSYIYQNIYDSPDGVVQIAEWYVDALTKAGWTLVVEPSDKYEQTQQYLVFEKKWNRQLLLSISASPSVAITKITIDMGPKYQDDDLLVN